MKCTLETKKICDLFIVKTGDFHATKELDPGEIPLISCGETDNGLVGYFDIPEEKRHSNCITVAYNGQPLLSKFHPYEFGAKDDVAVLLPRFSMLNATLFYIAAQLNIAKWRYNYGRKCFREKLKYVEIQVPKKTSKSGESLIDQETIAEHFPIDFQSLIPKKSHYHMNHMKNYSFSLLEWQNFNINDLLYIKRGDFHSLAALASGPYRTVSRVTEDNGTVGYYEKPENGIVYPRGSITVSTVGGDAFVQLTSFIATDNVLILTPKFPMQLETLFYIAFALNRQKWRYSYGRQCYKTKFEATTRIWLPITKNREIDEENIKMLIENASYWHIISDKFEKSIS